MRANVLAAAACLAVAAPAMADGPHRHAHAATPIAPAPVEAIAHANASARQGPAQSAYQQARQVYVYQPGAIYELYTNPNYVSSILLEPGESLITIAAGDTSRWMVTQAEGETGSDGRVIVLVKPQNANLRTNVVLITDRRTYLIEALSQAGAIYSAQIAWTYAHAGDEGAAPAIGHLNFNYRIRTTRGRRPAWRPARVFDDGRRTWIEFAPNVAASDMPPLFVISADGAEMVNYRVEGTRYLVDRIFDAAELRLGTRAQTIVRIERGSAQPRVPTQHGSQR